MTDVIWRAVAIDDQPDILRLYELMLRGSRIQLIGKATSGEEGLELVRRERPDLVILDLSMPGMDGLEVLERMRQEGTAARVAVVSGFEAARMEKDVKRMGADIYVEKGVSPRDMIRKLEQMADRKDPLDELI